MNDNRIKSWAEIVFGLINDIKSNIQNTVSESIRKKRNALIRKIIGGSFLLLGLLFLLGGLSILVNLAISSSWIGYAIVGVIVMIIGAVFLIE